MSAKQDDTGSPAQALTVVPMPAANAASLKAFRVKIRLDTPFDFAALQLYKAWPKPKSRRDN